MSSNGEIILIIVVTWLLALKLTPFNRYIIVMDYKRDDNESWTLVSMLYIFLWKVS
jgi:hypothetical protein